MYSLSITRNIPEQQLLDLLTTAVEAGIAYWMNEDSTDVEFVRNSDNDVDVVSFRNSCTGTEKVYTVKTMDILNAAQFILNNDVNLSSDIKNTIALLGTDDFDSAYDAETADVLFQYACFNELVYG